MILRRDQTHLIRSPISDFRSAWALFCQNRGTRRKTCAIMVAVVVLIIGYLHYPIRIVRPIRIIGSSRLLGSIRVILDYQVDQAASGPSGLSGRSGVSGNSASPSLYAVCLKTTNGPWSERPDHVLRDQFHHVHRPHSTGDIVVIEFLADTVFQFVDQGILCC